MMQTPTMEFRPSTMPTATILGSALLTLVPSTIEVEPPSPVPV